MAIGYGSRGAKVVSLQKRLNSLGAGLKVDGVWGPKTQAAYEKYGANQGSAAPAPQPAANANAAAPRVEYMRVTPMTEAQKRAAASAQVAPAYDARLKTLEEEYARNLQDNENEALKRGMSRSSYVLDVRSSTNARKAGEKSALTAERAAKIQALVAQLTQQDEKKAESARKYNNGIALQLEQMRIKQAEARRKYELELRKLAAQATKRTSSPAKASGGSKQRLPGTAAKAAAPVNYYDYYARNYLQKYGNNPTVARVLYYADRTNLRKRLGPAAVRRLDAIAERLRSNSVGAATAR